MKTIGLLGGMSWESTALYYRAINEEVKRRLGGHHSARIALVSVDFQVIKDYQHADQWEKAGDALAEAARDVAAAGADFLLICTNTMHKVADQIQAAIDIPIVHLADATGAVIKAKGMGRVGFLGTAFSMEQDFYTGRLSRNHGLDIVLPSADDRKFIHQTIYDELCQGVVRDESRERFLAIMRKMRDEGAEGVIEGCTEIVMLVQQQHTDIPLFDTTAIHAQRAVEMALA